MSVKKRKKVNKQTCAAFLEKNSNVSCKGFEWEGQKSRPFVIISYFVLPRKTKEKTIF